MSSAVERTDQVVVFDSDSDNDRPNQEPEFVIHLVDDHQQPRPAPPSQMRRLPAFQQLHVFQPQPQALPLPHVATPRRKICSSCFIARVINCALVAALAAVTCALALRLPKESAHGTLLAFCPMVICILALTWILAELVDDYYFPTT